MGGKVQAMAILHLSPLQVEILRRPSAGMVIPSVSKQDTADIHKQRRDRDRPFHLISSYRAASTALDREHKR
jgi:hypothetical protein